MERDTLVAILDHIKEAKQEDGGRYLFGETEMSLFIGTPGRGAEVHHVESLELLDQFLVAETEEKARLYLEYGSVHGINQKQPEEDKGKRTGFA